MKKVFYTLLLCLLTTSLTARSVSRMNIGVEQVKDDPYGIISDQPTDNLNVDFRTYFFDKNESFLQFGLDLNLGQYKLNDGFGHIETISISPLISCFMPLSPRLYLRGDFLYGYFTPVFITDDAITTMKPLYEDMFKSGPTFSAEISAGYYLSPKVIFDVGVGTKKRKNEYKGLSISAGFSISMQSNLEKLEIEMVKAVNILPVFYEYYTENPVFKIQVTNKERFPIKKLRVIMKRTSVTSRSVNNLDVYIDPGESTEIVIPIKLKDSVLKQIKTRTESLNLTIKYKAGAMSRSSKSIATFTIYGRNSFVWQTPIENEDEVLFNKVITANDGKVAVFVNPSDKDMIKLAHAIQNAYDDFFGFDNIPPNVKTIYKVVSYLQSRNLDYQSDPNSVPYGSENITVDYLKFPAETLEAGFGDCDDLSLLFAQLLECSGVKCGFITVPGHIYMAADSGMTLKEIKSMFGDESMFIFHNGLYYIPLEVTSTREGFSNTWKLGLSEWNKYVDERAFFALDEAWQQFTPVKVSLIKDITQYYPDESFKKYQESARTQLADMILDGSTDYATMAKKEYKLGLLEEAYKHMQMAIEKDPSGTNYYNAALIAYRMNNIEDTTFYLSEGAKISDNIRGKSLYRKFFADDLIDDDIDLNDQNAGGAGETTAPVDADGDGVPDNESDSEGEEKADNFTIDEGVGDVDVDEVTEVTEVSEVIAEPEASESTIETSAPSQE